VIRSRRYRGLDYDRARLRELRVIYGAYIPFGYGWPRVWFGALMLAYGAWLASAWLRHPSRFGFAWPALLTFGGLLLAIGIGDLRRERHVADEERSALAEWAELGKEIQLARRERRSVSRMLRRRGYRLYEIRRWIVHETDRGATP